MKILDELKAAAARLQLESEEQSVGVGGLKDDFARGLKVGKQSGLYAGYSELMRIIANHTCGSCGALIDNDADNINGRCVRCAKGETDVHIDD